MEKGDDDDDDDDMFAEPERPQTTEIQDEENEEDAYGKLKKKKVNFVDYKTIEGQELSDSEKDVEDEEESVPSTPEGGSEDERDSLDEELGPARSNKKIKMEKFNLRQEQAEGMFTEDGSFVRKAADPRAHQDSWMEGLTKGAIARARAGHEKQLQREAELERKEMEDRRVSPTERLERLIRCLKPRETPLDALARLNQGKKKWQPSQKWKKSKMDVDSEQSAAKEEAAKVKKQIEEITAHADHILNLGNQSVYSTPRERLIMLYQEDAGERFREDPINKNEVVQWEYKWPEGEEVYSGFAADDMRSWKEGGFFGAGVLCRPMGIDGEWKTSTEIDF